MSLSEFMKKNGDILEQISLYIYLKEGNETKEEYEAVVACRLLSQIWMKIKNPDSDNEKLRMETILAISNYIKANPHATQESIKQEVARQILLFSQKLE